MTETRRINPIFDRALQHSRWPSLKMTLFFFWLLVMAGIIYSFLKQYIFWMVYWEVVSELVAGYYIFFCLHVAIFSAPISALVTSLHLPSAIKTDHFQAIRVTGLPRHRILSGYLLVALYRLRVLWVLTFGVWFVLPIVLLDIYLYAWQLFGIPIMIWLIGVSLNWLAVCAGLWASVRWARKGSPVVATLALTCGTVLSTYGSLVISIFVNGDQQLWWMIVPPLVFVTSISLSMVLLHQAEQHI